MATACCAISICGHTPADPLYPFDGIMYFYLPLMQDLPISLGNVVIYLGTYIVDNILFKGEYSI